jgi:hypothetical protein
MPISVRANEQTIERRPILVNDGAGAHPRANSAASFAGWASVLLALKAAVDFGVDLRHHDPERTWDQGYGDIEPAEPVDAVRHCFRLRW